MEDRPGDAEHPSDLPPTDTGVSPWQRDDWVPDPFDPSWPDRAVSSPSGGRVDRDRSPNGDPDPPAATAVGGHSPAGSGAGGPAASEPETADTVVDRRRWIALAGAALVVAVVAVLLVRGDGGDDVDVAAASTSPVDGSTADPSTPVSSEPESDPDSESGRAVVAAPATTALAVDADTGAPPPGTVADGRAAPAPASDAVAQVVVGEAPGWIESTIIVPPPVSEFAAATEVIALTMDEVLHRVDLPSGRTRSVGVGLAGENPFLVIGEEAIVLYQGTRLVMIPDEGDVSTVEISDGVVFVQARPNSDQFIVTTSSPSASLGEREFLLTPDGQLDLIDDGPFSESLFWIRSFLPTGELIVDGPGGVYSINDSGTANRISNGDLVATGSHHYAVAECDESFSCADWIVDAATGDRVPAVLDGIATPGFVDPSTRISPDGGSIVFSDTTRGTGTRRIIDTATGDGVDVGRADAIVFRDTWAADSSGLFDERAGDLRFLRRDSAEVVVFEQFGTVVGVAARPGQ